MRVPSKIEFLKQGVAQVHKLMVIVQLEIAYFRDRMFSYYAKTKHMLIILVNLLVEVTELSTSSIPCEKFWYPTE